MRERRGRRKYPRRTLFEAFDKHDFSRNTCFLCGLRLTGTTRSDEHVFPQWLLQRFQLHNATLTLLNGTQIPYRQMTIPCCRICNNTHLSVIESRVRNVVEGHAPLDSLDDETIFVWLGKIFYGILYREVLLPMDRTGKVPGAIFSTESMQNFRMLHTFMQTVRIPISFDAMHASFPASIFAFKLQEPKTMKAKFDFRDSLVGLSVFIRMGSIGFIGVFDTGAVSFEFSHLYRKYRRFRLHPVQFEELGAAVFYKASLFDRVPKLMIASSPRRAYQITVFPLQGLSTRPVFQQWDTTQFAPILAEFVGAKVEQLLPAGASVTATFMRGPKSERYQKIDIRKSPYRGVE